MSSRAQYAPGAARGAEVRRDGDRWTLILVRELRHPAKDVWEALTDPEETSRVGAVRRRSKSWRDRTGEAHHGRGAKNHRLGITRHPAPTRRDCSSTAGARMKCDGNSSRSATARASRSGTTSAASSSRWARRLAHLPRRARSFSRRGSDGPHCWRRGDEVSVAAAKYRIREAVRHRRRAAKLNNVTGAQRAVKIKSPASS